MRGRFVTGALMGAAISLLLAPELDRTTRRRIKRTSRFMKDAAEEVYDNMIRSRMR